MRSKAHAATIRHRRFLAVLVAVGAAVLIGPATASAAETTQTFRVPITVKGYEVLQDTRFQVPAPTGPGFVTKMETDIVDASGNPVPISRLMLHHIVFVNGLKSDPTCGNNLVGWDGRPTGFLRERFFAAGEERAKMSMPAGYGYQLNPNQQFWGLLFMVMNHKGFTDSAFVEYKITVDDNPNLTPVTPYWMDVNNCHVDPVYNLPGMGKSGATSNRYMDFAMPQDGRIVAGIGHVHGGAHKLSLTQPGCGDRQIADSLPTWGGTDHPFYNVKPILHEPGPVHMTAFHNPTGIPINAGEVVRLNSLYDDSRPHTRVMGISSIYVAHTGNNVPANCGPLTENLVLGSPTAGRSGPPPQFTVPLTGLNRNGEAVTINAPPGKLAKLGGGSTIGVGDRFFTKPNVQIFPGKGLIWKFQGNELHNVTLANGPAGFASDNLDASREFYAKFPRKGTYRLFCSLHPVQMHQRVVVKKKQKRKKAKPGVPRIGYGL
jgi:plastocyanin